jgi:hypothetical protein
MIESETANFKTCARSRRPRTSQTFLSSQGDVNLVDKLSVHLEFEHNLDFHRRPLPVTGGSVEVKN